MVSERFTDDPLRFLLADIIKDTEEQSPIWGNSPGNRLRGRAYLLRWRCNFQFEYQRRQAWSHCGT